jgi:hypothetical protein
MGHNFFFSSKTLNQAVGERKHNVYLLFTHSSAKRYALGGSSIHKVRRFMRVGAKNGVRAMFSRHSRHMSVGKAVTTPSAYLKRHSIFGGQRGLIIAYQSGMGDYIHSSLNCGAVCPRRHRLYYGLAMRQNQFYAKIPALPDNIWILIWRNMGYLDSGYNFDRATFIFRAEPDNALNNSLIIGDINMIGYGQSPVTDHFGPSGKLRRQQLPIGEKRVRMQIYQN